MTATCVRTIGLSVLISLIALGTGTGCASLGRHFPNSQRPLLPPDQANTEPQSHPKGDTQSTLAAVEQFLARTKEYETNEVHSATTLQESRPDNVGSAPRPTLAAGPQGPPTRPPPGGASLMESDRTFVNTHAVLEGLLPREPVLALPVVQSISIRNGPQADAASSQPPRVTAANAPLDMGRLRTPVLVDELLGHLESRAKGTEDVASEWRLRMTQVALDRETETPEVSRSIPEETRGLLLALVHTAAAVRDVVRTPARSSDSALEWLEQLRNRLISRTSLSVNNVALCRKVITFGVYEEMSDADFTAGRTLRTIVYSEVRNFQSELTEDGHYRTELATRLEVLTADGRSLWMREEPQIVDLCRQRRHDFFIAQRITLPPTLPADAYVLKVLVEDKLSGKIDERAHPFTMRTTLSIAQGG